MRVLCLSNLVKLWKGCLRVTYGLHKCIVYAVCVVRYHMLCIISISSMFTRHTLYVNEELADSESKGYVLFKHLLGSTVVPLCVSVCLSVYMWTKYLKTTSTIQLYFGVRPPPPSNPGKKWMIRFWEYLLQGKGGCKGWKFWGNDKEIGKISAYL